MRREYDELQIISDKEVRYQKQLVEADKKQKISAGHSVSSLDSKQVHLQRSNNIVFEINNETDSTMPLRNDSLGSQSYCQKI
jgi:hypothetical protein